VVGIEPDAVQVLRWAVGVARALHELHRCQEEIRQYQTLLEAGQALRDGATALTAQHGIRDALVQHELAALDLWTNVVRYDSAEFGYEAESLGELAIRGVMFVVNAQLYRLREAFAGDDHGNNERIRSLFGDSFTGIDDMTWYLRREFDKINTGWTGFRATAPPCATSRVIGLSPSERVIAYWRGIRDAQRDLHALSRDSRVGPVLRRGWDVKDWPEVHSAMSVIFLVLPIQLGMDVAPFLPCAAGAAAAALSMASGANH
jgi:hypothetical protein